MISFWAAVPLALPLSMTKVEEKHLMGTIQRDSHVPRWLDQTRDVFKIGVPALLQKTQKSIVQVGGNRYSRLMDTGNCGWWAQWVEIHIDTDITGRWAPRGREGVTGCFDSLPPVNGSLSTELERSYCHLHGAGRHRVCVSPHSNECALFNVCECRQI